jgi:tetratricopeptide (TPR) repeat protein
VNAARRTVLMARAQFDEAAAIDAGTDPGLLDPMGLATRAVLAAERGGVAESEALFERARAKYRDVSPFPLAWMDFQRGSLLERRGDRARARLYFEEAHAALPGYAHPAVHLAGLIEPAAGVTLLAPLVGQTDDPQVDAAYADVLRRVGRSQEAKAATERARAGYDVLVARHPEAFADHAAQFYLGLGHDPTRALVLARTNAENRATEPALDLWMTAALVAGQRGEACTAAARGAALRHASSTFQTLVETTRAGCSTTVAARTE